MKFTLQEHDGCFSFEMEPETVAEAALLVRFALNCTKEVRSVGTTAYRDHSIGAHLVLGKRKQDSGAVEP